MCIRRESGIERQLRFVNRADQSYSNGTNTPVESRFISSLIPCAWPDRPCPLSTRRSDVTVSPSDNLATTESPPSCRHDPPRCYRRYQPRRQPVDASTVLASCSTLLLWRYGSREAR